MPQIDLTAGTVDYLDTGGDGPPLVLLHGLLMDASLWDGVIAELSRDHRCIAPTLPLGAHRHAMRDDADLSLPGVAALVAELLERLGLEGVTVIGNDTGGALAQLLVRDHPARLGAVVLVSCEAFDNLPPGLTGRTVVRTGELPPALFGLAMAQMRLKPFRRLPLAFGWLTRRGDAATARWARQVTHRRDAVKVLRAIGARPGLLEEAAEALPGFDRPALVVWASEDRVMPPEHGRRLAELLPRAELVEIDDSYTLIPLDRPDRLAAAIRDFTASGSPAAAPR
jgi:pimeloyl-ACP methyl ester carboxylesterase